MTNTWEDITQALEETDYQYIPEQTDFVDPAWVLSPEAPLVVLLYLLRIFSHPQVEERRLPIAENTVGWCGHFIIYCPHNSVLHQFWAIP